MVFMNGLGPDPLPAKEAEGPPVQMEPVDLSLRSLQGKPYLRYGISNFLRKISNVKIRSSQPAPITQKSSSAIAINNYKLWPVAGGQRAPYTFRKIH
ncbi:unnamed protein product [Ceratitis capitata]|uniref:(Mediterranean fruit fly) hypothetical protein n=1 Tax=Ceratitis capitata TaxID=7213 RepID=A0A811VDB4_CERCA|nr:unnamed protein product [Ceratitis capitata]